MNIIKITVPAPRGRKKQIFVGFQDGFFEASAYLSYYASHNKLFASISFPSKIIKQ